MLEGFFLGLSTGSWCGLTCGPILLPLLFAERRGHAANARVVILFLAGRFLAYLAVGAFLGAVGALALSYVEPALQHRLEAVAWLAVGAVLVAQAAAYLGRKWKVCALSRRLKPQGNALVCGIASGLAICPPFVAAASRVFGMASGDPVGGSLAGSGYFLLFFLGTTVFFLPLFGVSFLKKHRARLAMVSRLVMLMLGVYFLLFLGVFRLAGV
jgi:sulfite exporter TauE/SafE